MAAGIFLSGFSSIATGLNFMVSIHRLRAPGLTWYRMPVFLWSLYSLSVLMVLATPILAITLLLVAMERIFQIGVFDPAVGGDPLLFHHMFWFYSHPAVYIMILPGFGVISEIVPTFSRKRIFGYKFIVWASVSIAVVSFFVWGHHMFVSGMSLYAGVVFSILSYMVAVPSAIKVFNWLGTMHKGFIHFEAPMLYALGFIGLFAIGGLTGLWLAALGADVDLTQTYFVVAHFHYVMVGGMVSAFFGGLHYWWAKITGRMYPEMWARVAAMIMFMGFNLTFFPQFILGYLGMPRRYASYPPEFQVLNVLSSAGPPSLPPRIFCRLGIWCGRCSAVRAHPPTHGTRPDHWNQAGFDAGARETELWIGTLNTFILVTSSFAYATGLAFIRVGSTRRLIRCCLVTAALGLTFLALKFGLEWHDDFANHVFPNISDFKIKGPEQGGARLFFVFYFISTGLHGLHLVGGIGLVTWIILRARRGEFTPRYHTPVHVVGLYWSFVDIVWLTLYPLIYLIGPG